MKAERQEDPPATVTQLAAALAALGQYAGENSEAEHAHEAARLGGSEVYRMRLANTLLGAAQVQAMLSETAAVTDAQRSTAYRDSRTVADAEDDPTLLMGWLRWQALRVESPLREIAQREEAGPVPLAAAWAAEGLQVLLSVCQAGQRPAGVVPAQLADELRAARQALGSALANVDVMLQVVARAEGSFSR